MLGSGQGLLPREGASVEIVGTVINAAVVTAVGLILGWVVKGRIDRLEGEIGALRAEMNERFARVDDRMDRGFDSLRSDITRVALAVGARPEAEAGGR
jgi:hypothetical protein